MKRFIPLCFSSWSSCDASTTGITRRQEPGLVRFLLVVRGHRGDREQVPDRQLERLGRDVQPRGVNCANAAATRCPSSPLTPTPGRPAAAWRPRGSGSTIAPVTAYFNVLSDFTMYRSPTGSSYILVGYVTRTSYWLVGNSWGTHLGSTAPAVCTRPSRLPAVVYLSDCKKMQKPSPHRT